MEDGKIGSVSLLPSSFLLLTSYIISSPVFLLTSYILASHVFRLSSYFFRLPSYVLLLKSINPTDTAQSMTLIISGLSESSVSSGLPPPSLWCTSHKYLKIP